MRRKAEKSGLLSFFKVVPRKDFTRLLRLPPYVLKRKYGSTLPKQVKLRIESGRTWDVKVEAMNDGLFCFSRGWDIFAQDVGLKLDEFLVFTSDDATGFCFDVSLYESTGCKKEFPATKPVFESPLFFEIVLKPYHRSRITLGRAFTRAAGLIGIERVEVVGEHRSQWITLDDSQKWDAPRVDMAHGWPAFRTANRLTYDRSYSFEFKPGKNVIQVKEVKN